MRVAGLFGTKPALLRRALFSDGLFVKIARFLFTFGYVLMKTPSSWSSKIGFILSAAGSAIGLGAIWKFSYTAGTNGGAVFFLLFLLFTVLVALPVQLAEFYIGR